MMCWTNIDFYMNFKDFKQHITIFIEQGDIDMEWSIAFWQEVHGLYICHVYIKHF